MFPKDRQLKQGRTSPPPDFIKTQRRQAFYKAADSDSDSDSEYESAPPPTKKPRRSQPARSCRTHKNPFEVLLTDDSDDSDDCGTGSHKFETLKREILDRSVAKTWMRARDEWALSYIYYCQGGTCLCTHTPITEHCVIKNRLNLVTTIVGNVCIKQFPSRLMHVEDSCWACLRRLRDDPIHINLNLALLELAQRLCILNPREVEDYRKMTAGKGSRNRHNPESSEFDVDSYWLRAQINRRVLYGFHKDRPRCECKPPLPATPRYTPKRSSYFYTCWRGYGGCGFRVTIPK